MFGRSKPVPTAAPTPAQPPIVYPPDSLIAFARRIMYEFNCDQVDSGYMEQSELQGYIDGRTAQFKAMTQDVLALRLLRDMDVTAFYLA